MIFLVWCPRHQKIHPEAEKEEQEQDAIVEGIKSHTRTNNARL